MFIYLFILLSEEHGNFQVENNHGLGKYTDKM